MAPPDDVITAHVDLEDLPRELLIAAAHALNRLGQVHEVQEEGPVLGVRAVIPSGAMGMNPAAVEVEITPLDERVCRLSVTGRAKEGWIKQRAGEKAVRRVLAEMGFGDE